jgi:regulator of protease activity HflC (stomatin/prohibitin superfamily)
MPCPTLIVTAVLAVFVIIVVARSVRIVPQAREGVVERLGRYSRTLKPGLHVLIPFLDRLKPLVDMREQVITFPPQPVITEDNVTISIDTVPVLPRRGPGARLLRRGEPDRGHGAARDDDAPQRHRLAVARGDLTSRDKINQELRIVLDEATGPWGIRISRIELKSIDPPASIQEAMEKQMRAERSKRGHDPRGRGREGLVDPPRRGRAAVADPAGRGAAAVADPRGRGRPPGPGAPRER